MKHLTINTLEEYLKNTYQSYSNEQSLFMKLVEELGEVAEVLNIRSNRKLGKVTENDELANELVDMIHYIVAIAAVNDIDLEDAIIKKDEKASIKYNRTTNLKQFMSHYVDNVK